ncbi:exopolysaccharide biosynthesis operon protein EpsL [Afipia felis]|uniref:Exopolysaccharide biosynthesis operon protein EpsL n=1 Tax=Afipia felis TaxID=1035 RepID=A0A090MR25_AFIFE|nr:outer membrane beta-barrel protein [Afipia felis]CEG08079.1 exopolysaccharide biosynthesis operon protein EpsL [Afipia felis]
MKCIRAGSVSNAPVIRALLAISEDCTVCFVATTATFFLLFVSHVHAQAVPLNFDTVAPPWNALQVFEASPLPDFRDPNSTDPIPPEDMPVKKRQQPGYEPVGIRYGSWMINPALTSGGFFDSNVFSSNTTKNSDFAAVVEPTLRAHTLWERHGIDVKLDAQSMIYGQFSSLDQNNISLKGSGWYDVARDLKVLGSFQVAHLNEGVGTLSSPVNAVAPTPYNLYSGDVAVRKEFNRLAASVGMGVKSYDYQSTRAQDGSTINQDGRDGQIYTVHGRLDYAFSPFLGWFAALEGNERQIRGTPGHTLDSNGYRALSGITLGRANLLSGEIGGGYVSQRFDDPTIGTISGPSYHASLLWRPTRLLDIHAKAEQLVTETSDTSSSGVLANAFQVGADYELLRNVVISLSGGYENDKFFGQTRKDTVTSTDARIKYMLNRFASVSVYHRYTDRKSDIPAFSYEKHLVGINVTAQF